MYQFLNIIFGDTFGGDGRKEDERMCCEDEEERR